MKEFIDKLISRLEEEKQKDVSDAKFYRDTKNEKLCIAYTSKARAFQDAISIINELAEEYKGGWIACTVVDHPEHCNDCEVTFKDVRGYGRDIAFYTDKWRRASDEVPILVVAWKEPSAPYTEGE
jgi:hypothetical protein